MKTLIKLEDLGFFLLSLYFYSQTGHSWWLYALLILLPDIGMVGYAVNKNLGAIIYNIFHHRGLAVLLLLFGWVSISEYVALAGIILLSHASLDRVFGYGLKYPDDFKHTHMQEV